MRCACLRVDDQSRSLANYAHESGGDRARHAVRRPALRTLFQLVAGPRRRPLPRTISRHTNRHRAVPADLLPVHRAESCARRDCSSSCGLSLVELSCKCPRPDRFACYASRAIPGTRDRRVDATTGVPVDLRSRARRVDGCRDPHGSLDGLGARQRSVSGGSRTTLSPARDSTPSRSTVVGSLVELPSDPSFSFRNRVRPQFQSLK